MYHQWFYITEPTWNNEFSHAERMALWSEWKIYVPPIKIGSVEDLKVWEEITFEEVVKGKLITCKGLESFVETSFESIPIYIFDNHNHALFFRYRHMKQFEDAELVKPFKVLHIDQHSDLKPNINSFKAKNINPAEMFGFTNYACNVGNFISSALDAWLIEDCIQIRTESALHNLDKLDFQNYNYIVDIDIDFREWKTLDEIQKDAKKIKTLIKNSSLVTIATSPYFLDQKLAIKITKEIL